MPFENLNQLHYPLKTDNLHNIETTVSRLNLVYKFKNFQAWYLEMICFLTSKYYESQILTLFVKNGKAGFLLLEIKYLFSFFSSLVSSSSYPEHFHILIIFNFFFQLIFQGKGGKNRRRGKNENETEKRELVFKEDGQEYAQVLKMLGNGRLDAMCFDGIKRLCHIRGKLRKKVWINTGDIILLGLRDYQVNLSHFFLS